MITLSMLKSLRTIALSDTVERNYEAWFASLQRWYSREFNTALPVVEEMADEKVLETYYRDLFWRLASGDEKQKQALEDMMMEVLVDNHPDFKQQAEEIAVEDDDWYQQELAAIDKKLQQAEKSKKTLPKKDPGILISKPNLKNDGLISVEVNEPIPDDEGL